MAGLKASVEVHGLEDLGKILFRLGNGAARRVIRRAEKKAAESMLAATIAACPVDTGLMKSSLTVLPLKAKRGRIGFRVGFTNVEAILAKSNTNPNNPKRYFYPAVVEYGGKRTPHPFMRPAFDAHKEEAKAIIVEEVRNGIIKEAHKQSVGGAIERFAKRTGITRIAKKASKFGRKFSRKGSKLARKLTKQSKRLAKKSSKRLSKAVKKAKKPISRQVKKGLKNVRKQWNHFHF